MAFRPLDFLDFEAGGARAANLNREVNGRLLDSLRYVVSEVGPELECSGERLESWIGSLGSADRLDPRTHLLFHSIVAAVDSEDQRAGRAAMRRLLKLGPVDGLRIVRPGESEEDDYPLPLVARFADIEEANHLDLRVPDREETARATNLINAALAHIARNDPLLEAELQPLLRAIVLMRQGSDQRFQTGAVSCFQHWGGLLLNADVIGGAPAIVEMLAHEATHLLLFALALDGPLLNNPPEKLYYSPLRGKERTMDGVYHAAIVSARVGRAMLRQLDGSVPDDERAAFAVGFDRAIAAFDECRSVVDAYADLTPIGSRMLEACVEGVAQMRGRLPIEAASRAA